MAYVAKDHEEDETQLGSGGATQPQAQATPQDTQAGTAQPATTAAKPTPVRQAPQGRFQDIQRLLSANQGQGAALAQRATDTASKLGQMAQQHLTQATSAYGAQTAAGTPKAFAPQTPPPLVGTGSAAPVAPQPVSTWGMYAPPALPGAPGGAFASRPTTTINQGQPDAATVANAAGATYTGPHSLADTQGVDLSRLAAEASNADATRQALGSQTGVSSILGTRGGAGALDSLLAFNEGGGQLRNAAASFPSIRDQLAKAQGDTSLGDAGAASAASTAAAAKAYQGDQAAQAAQESVNKQVDQNATDMQAADDKSLGQWVVNYFSANPMLSAGMNIPKPGTPAFDSWVAANRDQLTKYRTRAGGG